MLSIFKLKGEIGASRDSDRKDVLTAQRALNRVGFFEPDPVLGFNGFLDRRLDAGIRRFQKSRGLLVTGEVNTGDETEESINSELRQAGRAGTSVDELLSGTARDDRAKGELSKRREGDSHRRGGLQLSKDADDFDLVGPGQVNQPDRAPIRPEAQAEIDAARKEPQKALVFRMRESREWAIKNDWPAKFNIKDNPKWRGFAPLLREHHMGVKAVRKNDAAIEKESRSQGVDPDLIRAIMYVENADGSRFGISKAADVLGLSSTLFPMNINPRIWDGMGGVRAKDFEKAELNVRAAVALIKTIRDRIEDEPSKGSQSDKRRVAKIGSIWNFAGSEEVNDVGARIQRAFDEKLWTR